METEYERLKKQFERINKNRNTELIDSYINILSQNEQEILSLNTELNDRDNLITKLHEQNDLKLEILKRVYNMMYIIMIEDENDNSPFSVEDYKLYEEIQKIID